MILTYSSTFSTFRKSGAKLLIRNNFAPLFLKVEKVEKVN